jgi:hypothetical protein
MGYSHSDMNRGLTTAGASNIIMRLASRSITGYTLPIQVHQHYGLEFHLLLNDTSCIRRGCWHCATAQQVCTQLQRSALEGVHSCVFDDRRVFSMSDKVEPCFRADPVFDGYSHGPPCDCGICTDAQIIGLIRWLRKMRQATIHYQRDICCCRRRHVEMLDN